VSDVTDDIYLIFSFEHGAWWGPGECGYVRQLSKAGRYTRDRAVAICIKAIPGTSTRMGALPELPVRLADLDTMTVAYFDEYLHRDGKEPWQ
jgi:hypothetical protein